MEQENLNEDPITSYQPSKDFFFFETAKQAEHFVYARHRALFVRNENVYHRARYPNNDIIEAKRASTLTELLAFEDFVKSDRFIHLAEPGVREEDAISSDVIYRGRTFRFTSSAIATDFITRERRVTLANIEKFREQVRQAGKEFWEDDLDLQRALTGPARRLLGEGLGVSKLDQRW